jgi:hypothetical protein
MVLQSAVGTGHKGTLAPSTEWTGDNILLKKGQGYCIRQDGKWASNIFTDHLTGDKEISGKLSLVAGEWIGNTDTEHWKDVWQWHLESEHCHRALNGRVTMKSGEWHWHRALDGRVTNEIWRTGTDTEHWMDVLQWQLESGHCHRALDGRVTIKAGEWTLPQSTGWTCDN